MHTDHTHKLCLKTSCQDFSYFVMSQLPSAMLPNWNQLFLFLSLFVVVLTVGYIVFGNEIYISSWILKNLKEKNTSKHVTYGHI